MTQLDIFRTHFWQKISRHPHFWWWTWGILAVLLSLQKWSLPPSLQGYTSYENYRIFRNAFPHLLEGINIYTEFWSKQWDLYKYSPAFAIAMAPFSYLPDWLGLCLWNLLNAFVLLSALRALPVERKSLLLLLVLPELVINLQNSQSNGLVAGMMIWVWVWLRRGDALRAGAMAAAVGFIKIFGIFAAVLLPFFWNGKWSFVFRFATGFVLSSLIFSALPLFFLDLEQTQKMYRWWWEMLRNDHDQSLGLSVMGWLASWWYYFPPKKWVVGLGLTLFLAAMTRIWQQRQRLDVQIDLLAATLIWVIIFNHKAESPTFIIAMCGAVLWWFVNFNSTWRRVWLCVAIVFSSFSPTDIFPRWLREQWVQPYVLKVIPFIIIWLSIIYYFILQKKQNGISEK